MKLSRLICLQCLVTKPHLIQNAIDFGTISKETHEEFFDELADWKKWKLQQHSSSSVAGHENNHEEYIVVSLLSAHHRININTNSTTKDVKLELGKLISRNPSTIRLLFHGKDVKV